MSIFQGGKLISQDIFSRGSIWNFERGYVHRSVSPVFSGKHCARLAETMTAYQGGLEEVDAQIQIEVVTLQGWVFHSLS